MYASHAFVQCTEVVVIQFLTTRWLGAEQGTASKTAGPGVLPQKAAVDQEVFLLRATLWQVTRLLKWCYPEP